jgi:hypothetical protein
MAGRRKKNLVEEGAIRKPGPQEKQTSVCGTVEIIIGCFASGWPSRVFTLRATPFSTISTGSPMDTRPERHTAKRAPRE